VSEVRERAKAERAKAIGWWVFGGLGLLTAIEYLVAVEVGFNLFWLTQIAALKAGLIAYYFMHIARAWARGGEGH
jgi:cytochrome c oxidase subunit IV